MKPSKEENDDIIQQDLYAAIMKDRYWGEEEAQIKTDIIAFIQNTALPRLIEDTRLENDYGQLEQGARMLLDIIKESWWRVK